MPDQPEKTFTIIVLSDGETWTEDGTILEITQYGYDLICDDGLNPYELDDDDILKTTIIP